jgi:TPR repeat protein
MYDTQGDLKQANYWYTKAALNGSSEAQYRLGLNHLNGKGTEQSDEEALIWFEVAAEQNNPRALHRLGSMYEKVTKIVSNEIVLEIPCQPCSRRSIDRLLQG